MMRQALFVFVALVLVQGCSKSRNNEQVDPPTACSSDLDCNDGQYCSAGGCIAGATIPASNPPAVLEPTDPGLFSVGPQGLYLQPGATTDLWARFETADGERSDVTDVTWTSSDESVITIEGSTATAVGQGFVELRADAGSVGRGFLPIVVTDDPPDGPTAVEFGVSSLILAIGDSSDLALTATDAAGDATGVDGISLTWAGPDGVVEFDGLQVTALRAGGGEILAMRNDEILGGSLPVAVLAEKPPAGCDGDDYQLMSCGVVYYPHAFSKPGLSATLEVWVQEVSTCGTRLRRSIRTRLRV